MAMMKNLDSIVLGVWSLHWSLVVRCLMQQLLREDEAVQDVEEILNGCTMNIYPTQPNPTEHYHS